LVGEETLAMLESEAWNRFLKEDVAPAIRKIEVQLLGDEPLEEGERKGLVLARRLLKGALRKPYDGTKLRLPDILAEL